MKKKLATLLLVAVLITNSSLLTIASSGADASPNEIKSSSTTSGNVIVTIGTGTAQTVSGCVSTDEGTKNIRATASVTDADIIIALVNDERRLAGLPALVRDDTMYEAAVQRSFESSLSFSHTRPDGTAWNSVNTNINGENLASGFSNTDSVMKAWMNSDGHRGNILNPKFTRISVAAIQTSEDKVWVQLFGV